MTAHSIPSLCFRLSKKATITISIFKNNKTIIELLTKFSNDGFFANCAIIKTAMNKKQNIRVFRVDILLIEK